METSEFTPEDVHSPEMRVRAVEAAVRFLERQNQLEFLQFPSDSNSSEDEFDIIAKDENGLVFIDVDVTSKEDGYHELDSGDRAKKEIKAANWFLENQLQGDIPIRFDQISLMIFNDKQAMVRYHKNCMTVNSKEE